jgi:hypothetical protein
MTSMHNDDDENVIKMTPQAHTALAADQDGTAPLDPRTALSLEVMWRLGGECAGWEFDQACEQILAMFGDDAKALAALRNGEVHLNTN